MLYLYILKTKDFFIKWIEALQLQRIINSSVDEGKKVLYLVLKKKSFSRQIIEEIEKEVEKRIPAFIQSITPKLENMKFKEQSLK